MDTETQAKLEIIYGVEETERQNGALPEIPRPVREGGEPCDLVN